MREKHITRDKAKTLVGRYDGEFSTKFSDEFLEYIGMAKEYFFEIVDDYRIKYPQIWKKANNEWLIRHTHKQNWG